MASASAADMFSAAELTAIRSMMATGVTKDTGLECMLESSWDLASALKASAATKDVIGAQPSTPALTSLFGKPKGRATQSLSRKTSSSSDWNKFEHYRERDQSYPSTNDVGY